ncbi:MAG TPA: peroxiredoxin [Acidimicrobiales bacterium]|nr:peroxiredoxin [Acidimicrobiales bacterium]
MRVGDPAPDFTLRDHDGRERRLSDFLATGPVVLFFYPAASTSGCTRETCHFRDLAGEFAAYGASRVGISMDSVDKQAAFAENNRLDYPLLADVGGAVARLYGVKRALDLLRVRRTTFVIDATGVVREIIASELNMNVHADRALAALAAL